MLIQEESNDEKYHIRIIRRDGGGQAADDYHATVTRLSDRMELVFINSWKWFLKLRLRRWYLNREFRYQDKRDAKLAREETFTK